MTEMSDSRLTRSDDDVEGHASLRWNAEAEATEGDDDTEGHAVKLRADAEDTEGDDDTEGHGIFWRADAEAAEGDVEGTPADSDRRLTQPHDRFAVRVDALLADGSATVGYLPREFAREYQPALLAGTRHGATVWCAGRIAGGGPKCGCTPPSTWAGSRKASTPASPASSLRSTVNPSAS